MANTIGIIRDQKAVIEALRKGVQVVESRDLLGIVHIEAISQEIECESRKSIYGLARSEKVFTILGTGAPVAQLDRASVYETEGYTFEPCRVYLVFPK